MFADGDLHEIMRHRTRRWSNVLRHKIGQEGSAVECDETGWVSVEDFIRNDHCWPLDHKEKAYNPTTKAYNETVIQKRREDLMHGYWWTLNCKPIKRRFMMVAQVASKSEWGEIRQNEDPEIHEGDRIVRAKGWMRPVAIRATSGHSFTGDHGRPLSVNIDHENVNIKFTRELAFKMAGGYHVTEVRNLMSIVNFGIIPGGGGGGRDHAFFGEYAPWDWRNASTLNYLGSSNDYLLVLYVPAARLLKYGSGITYHGDIVVLDTVPFTEVQEIWICGKSPGRKVPALDPRRITSHKVIDEVVIQCEYANMAAPPPVIRSLMDEFVGKAKEIGREDVAEELIEAWEAYSNNPNNGKAAADMGVAMVLARRDLYPKKCLQNRICPNCMFEQAKFFLSCPRCKGKFISAGVTNHSSPTMILTTKEEIDKMIRENEEALAQLHFPDDDALTEEMEVETQKDIKKEYSPHDEEMDDEEQTEEAEDTNVNDEANSIMVNYERLSQDLINYNGGCALNTDPDEKISRYILFKIADFCVHHFGYWKRYVFEETDNSRARLLGRGCRHEVTGEDHPVLRATLGGEFALDRGLPVTVGDTTLYQVYHGRFVNKDTRIEAEEMARRYRFGVVVTKLVEALYRRGYDLERDFRTRVQACNSMSDQTTIEAMRTPAQLKEDVGIVETAMKEAIRIAFPDCQTYSFFSPLNPPGNYRINVHEFQSFYEAKSKNKITGEMVHVMHYYGVQNVPSFEELTRKYKAKNEDKPVKLKYLSDSAASGMRGFNMLMPVNVEQAQSSGTQDVPMVEVEQTRANEVVEVEQTGETEVVENMSVEVVEVAELPTPEAPTGDIQMEEERDTTEAPKPDPPLAPLIETIEPETFFFFSCAARIITIVAVVIPEPRYLGNWYGRLGTLREKTKAQNNKQNPKHKQPHKREPKGNHRARNRHSYPDRGTIRQEDS